MNKLTEQELIYYGNFAHIEECDCCHDYKQIINEHNENNFIVYNGKQFLCRKCRV